MNTTNRPISVRVCKTELDHIRARIDEGYANNLSDYARQAIREKIARDELKRCGGCQ